MLAWRTPYPIAYLKLMTVLLELETVLQEAANLVSFPITVWELVLIARRARRPAKLAMGRLRLNAPLAQLIRI